MNFFALHLFGYVFLGEMIGTLLLVFFGNGAMAMNFLKKTVAYKSGWLYVNIGWGAAVAFGALFAMVIEWIGTSIAFSHTHEDIKFVYGLINPAFDVAMFVSGIWSSDVGWLGAFLLLIVCIVAQFIGALIGQILLDYIYWRHFKHEDLNTIKRMHCTIPNERNDWTRNIFTEFIGASIFVGIGVIACGIYAKNIGNDLWVPFAIGLSLMLIRSSIGSPAMGVNPARDLAPRLVFYLLPLYKLGFNKKEQRDLTDWKYAMAVPLLSPIIAGLIIGGICWLVPEFNEAYNHSIYSKDFWKIFSLK